MSPESAGLAKKLGYTNVKVMLKGVPAWKKLKQKVVASDDFINTGNIILVDLRSPGDAAQSHIPRAVNIPFEELEDAEDDFPLKAPVVVYGSGDAPQKAYEMIAGWGLKTVALIESGLEGYKARGNTLVSDQLIEEIAWVRQLGKGEVSLEEFMSVPEGRSDNMIILDVRGADETASGTFAPALALPLDTLEAKISDLPKDKELLIHCSTGARAEMAHDLLQKQGFRTRFLVADVTCEKGVCSAE
jgi:rhodanese-related sulfurtransferase